MLLSLQNYIIMLGKRNALSAKTCCHIHFNLKYKFINLMSTAMSCL